MDKKINEFRNEHFFLSNFYMSPVTYDGITYTNNEAAFQAQKCSDKTEREAFAGLNPSEAKGKGRHVKLRSDWEYVKTDIMYEIVKAKFEQNPVLRIKLQGTGNCILEEGNTWGDKVWGTVNGKGRNRLGIILMKVRNELKTENELIILERENGFYGGYIIAEDEIRQVFNSTEKGLFHSIKNHAPENSIITCLDKSQENEFMKNRNILIGREGV